MAREARSRCHGVGQRDVRLAPSGRAHAVRGIGRHTLRARVLGAMFVVFVVATVSFLLMLNSVVTHSFSELEAENVLQDTARARTAFNAYAVTLRAVASDWAHWTETYDFVAGRRPEYPAQNLSGGALANINVDFMVFLNGDGEPVHAIATDPSTGELVEIQGPVQRAVVSLNRTVAPASRDGYPKRSRRAAGRRGGHGDGADHHQRGERRAERRPRGRAIRGRRGDRRGGARDRADMSRRGARRLAPLFCLAIPMVPARNSAKRTPAHLTARPSRAGRRCAGWTAGRRSSSRSGSAERRWSGPRTPCTTSDSGWWGSRCSSASHSGSPWSRRS